MLEMWLSTVHGYLRGYVAANEFGFSAVVRFFVKFLVFHFIVHDMCDVFDGG